MRGRHFDVIVVGLGLPSLLAASLLARRDFSVLLLGDGSLPPTYHLGELPLRRRSFSLTAGSSPSLKRALAELSQSQVFGRRVRPREGLGVLLPGARFVLARSPEARAAELSREMPEVARVLDALVARTVELDTAMDEKLSGELTLPPGTFLERRRAELAFAGLPLASSRAPDPLDDFPSFHALRGVLGQALRFATHAEGKLPALATTRLLGAILSRPVEFRGAEDDARQFFVERLLAYGGTSMPEETVARVLADTSGVRGVALESDGREVGCRFLVFAGTGEALAGLAGGDGVLPAARRSWPRVLPGTPRFVTSVVVRSEGVPELLPDESLWFAGEPSRVDPFRPPLHVQASSAGAGAVLLTVEVLLSDEVRLGDARALVLSCLVGHLPYLERHLLAVDSPHDGQPAWVYDGSRGRQPLDRLKLRGASLGREPMETCIACDDASFFGLAVEPIRGPIERTFLVGPSVLPPLGQEGELVAAESAARLITKADPNRQRMRIDLFGRVELG